MDAVVELIYCTSHRGRPKDDMAPLVQLIVPEVMALKPRCVGGMAGVTHCEVGAEVMALQPRCVGGMVGVTHCEVAAEVMVLKPRRVGGMVGSPTVTWGPR